MTSWVTSNREKRLWTWTLVVILVIFSSLIFSSWLFELLNNQTLSAFVFLVGMLLAGITMVLHALRMNPGKQEIALWLGFATIYIMFFLRLTLAERSHLIEYSVLTVFIHEALLERKKQGREILYPPLLAVIFAAVIGVIDECVQYFIPDRVFDLTDMLFNALAALTAMVVTVSIAWVRKRFTGSIKGPV